MTDTVQLDLRAPTVADGAALWQMATDSVTLEVILRSRGLDYKVQFRGPTGTNSVESALKLAARSPAGKV